MIAVTHPGKIGDCLYALPAIKKLSEKHGSKIDFYTSSYCSGLKRLFEFQKYINSFNIVESYKIQRMDMGVQPWKIDIPEKYDKVFHLGFRETPYLELPVYMAKLAEVELDKYFTVDFPEFSTLDEPYIVIAPRGDVDFLPHYRDFFNHCSRNVVVVGSKNDYPGFGIDMTGLDFLETATWISKSIGFIGISSMFVLADFFSIPKVVLHKSGGLDIRHLTHNNTTYISNYNFSEIIRRLGIMKTYSKTMKLPEDYTLLGGYAKHIDNLLDHFKSIKFDSFRYEHQHRKWEYALVYKLVDLVKARSVLDVGGGGSILAPALAWVEVSTTVIDPGEVGSWIEKQSKMFVDPINFIQKDFISYNGKEKYDVVCSTSTIEHLPNDIEFITKLGKFVKKGGLLVLTFDFHPDGGQKVSGHIRAYNTKDVENIISEMKKQGFTVFGGEPDYSYFDGNVNGCTFASLVLKKESLIDDKRMYTNTK